MNRLAILLSVAGTVLLLVVFFLLVFQPAREELAEVEERIALEQEQQRTLQAEIDRLRTVREDAPGVEAELAAAEAIVPSEPALPALVRQLQLAADEAGVTLLSVATSRPVALVEPPETELSSIGVDTQLQGTYFQVVDFLRRVEEPDITPRGIVWNNTTVARTESEYPELLFSLSGSTFAIITVPLPAEPEPDPDAEAPEEGAEEPAPGTNETEPDDVGEQEDGS